MKEANILVPERPAPLLPNLLPTPFSYKSTVEPSNKRDFGTVDEGSDNESPTKRQRLDEGGPSELESLDADGTGGSGLRFHEVSLVYTCVALTADQEVKEPNERTTEFYLSPASFRPSTIGKTRHFSPDNGVYFSIVTCF